jgi:aspartate/methionine/tyrosine aminotransferase
VHPSYPLVDELARVENVTLRSVALHWHGRWELDLDAMRAALGPRTRAVMVVHPNNPTGSFVTRDERDALATLCATHEVALVVDEVFGDYAWRENPRLAPSFVEEHRALTFTLSGISKVLCLPQMKLGWIALNGPETLRNAALARIETLADCYLSVASPVQRALPWLFAERSAVQGAVMARIGKNLRALDAAIGAASPVQRLASDGGWYAVLRVPVTRSDDAWVLHLLDTTGCLTQPGWLFDFARPGYLVLSLLPDPVLFAEAIVRVVRCIEGDVA